MCGAGEVFVSSELICDELCCYFAMYSVNLYLHFIYNILNLHLLDHWVRYLISKAFFLTCLGMFNPMTK